MAGYRTDCRPIAKPHHQWRLFSVRFQLLRPLSTGCTAAAGSRPRRRTSWVSNGFESSARRGTLVEELLSANGMARPCSYPARRRVLRGIKRHKEHVPCHTNPHQPPSARSASISARIASILSVSINAGRSFGNSNARAQLERRLPLARGLCFLLTIKSYFCCNANVG